RGPGAPPDRGGARGSLPRDRRAAGHLVGRAWHRPLEDEIHDARAVGVAHLVAEEAEATLGPRESLESREDLSLKTVDFEALRRRLSSAPRVSYDVPGHRRAAVLVPLLERDGETRIVFTLRSAALRNHSGQWSFPGGGCDESDASAMATAAREAREEVGIDPA